MKKRKKTEQQRPEQDDLFPALSACYRCGVGETIWAVTANQAVTVKEGAAAIKR